MAIITVDLFSDLISRMVGPKTPWALKIYEVWLRFGDSALGKLDRRRDGLCLTIVDGSDKAKIVLLVHNEFRDDHIFAPPYLQHQTPAQNPNPPPFISCYWF